MQAALVVRDVEEVVGPDRWTTWEALTARVSRATVSTWVATGKLVRTQPGVYLPAGAGTDWRLRLEAVLRTRRGVASHATALTLWGLAPPGEPLHVSVDPSRSGRGSAGVVLHRTAQLEEVERRVDGLPVTCVERAVVDAWGTPGALGRPAVRAAAITAVRERLCRPADLALELRRRPTLPRRAELASLVQLLADGCRSELEIWGCVAVLRGPGMPPFVLQRPVAVAGRRFFLDAACEEVLLAVELDGAAWHGSRAQRERDIRRDVLVASIGWQTLRFAFTRMTDDPAGCRRDILATYHARRALFARNGGR